MIRMLGCTLFVFALGLTAIDAGGARDAVKKDDAKDKGAKDKKYEVPKDAHAAKIKSVNMKEPSFTATMKNGKDRKFLVDAKTEFYGPRGGDRGTGAEGLKDDCMEKGYEVWVLASKDGKTASEVHLPDRKSDKEKDKK